MTLFHFVLLRERVVFYRILRNDYRLNTWRALSLQWTGRIPMWDYYFMNINYIIPWDILKASSGPSTPRGTKWLHGNSHVCMQSDNRDENWAKCIYSSKRITGSLIGWMEVGPEYGVKLLTGCLIFHRALIVNSQYWTIAQKNLNISTIKSPIFITHTPN